MRAAPSAMGAPIDADGAPSLLGIATLSRASSRPPWRLADRVKSDPSMQPSQRYLLACLPPFAATTSRPDRSRPSHLTCFLLPARQGRRFQPHDTPTSALLSRPFQSQERPTVELEELCHECQFLVDDTRQRRIAGPG